MKRRTVLSLTFTMILCMTLATANSWAKYETISPEILQQYDPEILSGERPKLAIVTNADIWDLREHPDRGGDLVLVKLKAKELSSVQMEVFRNWLKKGTRVYLEGDAAIDDVCKDILQLDVKWVTGCYRNKEHPVNTDVQSLDYASNHLALTNLPPESSIIVSGDQSHTKVVVGAFRYGEGYVYFNPLWGERHHYLKGHDRDRFYLNFNQWLIGKKVPGAASTEVFGPPSPELPKEEKLKIYDLLTLRNGDNLSGTILNESFTIQTTYATLSFPKNEIKRIVFESEKAEIQIMELLRGDILRGVIKDEIIDIDIPSAGKTPIEQDKIREINFTKKQTTE